MQTQRLATQSMFHVELESSISEQKHQIFLIDWAKLHNIPLVQIPNEGKRTRRQGAIMKKMGLTSGLPDLMLLEARGGFFGLFIEMKRNRRYRKSEMRTPTWIKQEQILQKLNKEGYKAVRVFGWEDGANILKSYYDMPRTVSIVALT